MLKANSRKLSYLSRQKYVAPEIDNVFQLAIHEKYKELSDYILDKKNEIWKIKKGDDITILHSACVSDNFKLVKLIIESTKKRLNLISENSISQEEKSNNENIFKDFINAKTETEYLTALHYAAFRGNIKMIDLLIQNYANVQALTYNGLNMLHKGAQGNSPNSIIYFYKKYKIDITSTNNDKLNALHFAAISGMDYSIIYLLNLGLNPNLQDIHGNTALHYAVKYGHNRIIKKLLQNGADKNILNKNKISPAILARENPELSDIFEIKGICQKLFFKPDINKKSKLSNINMLLFIILHFTVIFLTFIMLMPYFDNTYFSILYLIESFLLFILFFILSFSDPGTLINKKYKNFLDIIEQDELLEYYCPKCLIKMNYRTKHCLICEKCIDNFDHHCFWVGNCIGKKNFSLFFNFLIYVIFNTLFNFTITTYYVFTEMSTPYGEKTNDAFPGFYFGVNSVIYKRAVRIVVSIFISAVCVLFFIPLIDLFQIQWNNLQERKQLILDEEEYEKGLLNEKLIDEEDKKKEKMEEEVWDDEKYDKEEEIGLK